ncbi:MAG: peptide deformylase, partial [Streptococcaceae bacterium]|nr:peptide deformylase [Streptococcaceae bacterium]
VRGKLIYTGDSAYDPAKDPRIQGQPLELINPEIIETAEEQVVIEGCFSIPFLVIVPRPKYIKVKAYDRSGREFTLELNEAMANGDQTELAHILFSAHLICHECEHLDGILCSDKALICDIPQSITKEDLRILLITEREKYFKIG